MSVRLEYSQGDCPQCGNGSIYKERKYKFPYKYEYTIEECKMGPECDYKIKVNENTSEILESNFSGHDKLFIKKIRNKKIEEILK